MTKFIRLFILFLLFSTSCASHPTLTPKPSNSADISATSASSTTSNGEYIALNVFKESDTYIAFLPAACLRSYQNCSQSTIYSPDVYQKEMVSPLAWDPKGQQFVILTNLSGNQDISIGAFANGKPERFTIETPQREDCPIWSPNGQTILFTKEVQGNGEYQSELWTINGDGSNSRFLTNGNCGDWSPDGQHIVYSIYSVDQTISRKIYVLDLSATSSDKPSYITLTTDLDYIGKTIYSPDGKKIAFEGFKNERWSIYLMNINGSEFLELTPMLPDATSPVWSPNGQKLAFITHSSHLEPGEIYVIDANGTNLINISNSPTWNDSYPSWSPDNSMVVFMSQGDTGFSNIYVVNSNGTELKKLTKANSDIEFMYPVWQP